MIHHRIISGIFRTCVLTGLVAGFISSTQAEVAKIAAKRMGNSTVRIHALSNDVLLGTGSGFIISSKGHVATNRHVIASADEALVIFARGDRLFIYPASLAAVSQTVDLAILKIEPIPGTKAVQLASAELTAGQAVVAVGFPGAMDEFTSPSQNGIQSTRNTDEYRITCEETRGYFIPAVFSGAVAKTVTQDGCRWIHHSAKISGGNSGGPLADAEGRVCGINTAGLIGAVDVGVDYPMSIHASELIALARANSIPINVTSSKVKTRGANSALHILLYLALAAFAVVLFLMVLRKPRAVMVDAMSRAVGVRRKPDPGLTRVRKPSADPQARPSAPAVRARGTMRLRGRDLQGISYDLAFSTADFQRSGGRLVIGRNNDLSQLVLPQDSVSRQHATLLYHGGSVQVEDRNSGNGTSVNGRDVMVGQPAVPLHPGDKLTLGEVDLVFEITP